MSDWIIPIAGVLIFLILIRWAYKVEQDKLIQEQINEDTCQKHGVFCCPICTDQSTGRWEP